LRIAPVAVAIILLTAACSSPNDTQDACGELKTLINQLDTNQLKSLDVFHETVDAILVHARAAGKSNAEFAQLANKVQSFASLWYAKAGSTIPTSDEAVPLKALWDTYCKNLSS
jgi:hypothetical protein